MRILVVYAQPVFWSMGEGRGAAIFTRLPEAIAARGHEVRVCLPVLDEAAAVHVRGNGALPPEEPYHGFLLHRFPARRGFVPNADRALAPRLRDRLDCWLRYQRWGDHAAGRLAAAFPPDLILGMGYYEAPVARRLARKLGVPNVTRLFGNTLSLSLHSRPRFYANFPEVAALRTPADLILMNDDGADGEAVARRLRVPRERFVHLRNGVDFGRFHPGPPSGELRRKLGILEGQFMLLTGTRLAPEKKLERAIAGLHRMVEAGRDAVLVLPGDGQERPRLEKAARAAGVAGRVIFPGPVRQEEMADWYRTADVFLSLLDRTNAANPVFEAMACGRPVVVLEAGTTRAVVHDGETGVVLPREDLPVLGDVLASLLGDEERRRRLGAAAAVSIRTLVMDLRERLDYEARLVEEVGMNGTVPSTTAMAARQG